MEQRGSIYLHKKLEYENGTIGTKFLILLNFPSKNEPYLFVKTTSQSKNKPLKQGCIKERQLFSIPAKTTFFPKPTWIQLYRIYEIPAEDIKSKTDIRIVNSLDKKLIEQIVDCLFLAAGQDIMPEHKRLLEPSGKIAYQKLLEKWSKKH